MAAVTEIPTEMQGFQEEEECIEWGDEVTLPSNEEEGATDPESKGSMIAGICTVLFSLPALVGSWCWPVLLGAIIPSISSGVNTMNSQQFSHSLTFGLNFAVLTNMLQFMYNKRSRMKANLLKREDANVVHLSHWQVWGPCWFLFASIFLVMADLTRHLVNDSWKLQKCSEPQVDQDGIKKQTCEVHAVMNEYLPTGALSIYGITFTIICTWLGFTCMAIGIFWGLDMPRKIKVLYQSSRNNPNNVTASRSAIANSRNREEPLLNPSAQDP